MLELEKAQIRKAHVAMRWRAEMVEGLGKKGEQFVIVLDIARVLASDQLLVEAAAAAS